MMRSMNKIIKLVEVGPRDGLQNIKTRILPAKVKATYINKLIGSGLRNIEVGSFVSDSIPQMRSTREVIGMVHKTPLTNLIALVGNKHYAEEAASYPVDTLAVFTTISESFSQKNNGCDLQKNILRSQEICKIALYHQRKIRGYVSCVFGCPYEGYGDENIPRTVKVVQQLLDAGCDEVSIADTAGSATAYTIVSMVEALKNHKIDLKKIAIHLHDPKGRAKKNLMVAIACGLHTVDCATGEIGGCPNDRDPSSNIDTLVVLETLKEFGLFHDAINPDLVREAAKYINYEF